MTPLHVARCAFAVKTLLLRGANVNAVDSSGRTPLHCAAERHCSQSRGQQGQTLISCDEVLEQLLVGGADPNLLDKQGRMASHIDMHVDTLLKKLNGTAQHSPHQSEPVTLLAIRSGSAARVQVSLPSTNAAVMAAVRDAFARNGERIPLNAKFTHGGIDMATAEQFNAEYGTKIQVKDKSSNGLF